MRCVLAEKKILKITLFSALQMYHPLSQFLHFGLVRYVEFLNFELRFINSKSKLARVLSFIQIKSVFEFWPSVLNFWILSA